jgi:hypothetical protein
MSELVKKLSDGLHPVELVLRPEKTSDALKECLERRYVHIKFVATKGGTELGLKIDENTSQSARAAVDAGADSINVVGDLVLDYVPVRCVAKIDLSTWQGTGHLEVRVPVEVN